METPEIGVNPKNRILIYAAHLAEKLQGERERIRQARRSELLS
jgi:hypothetical protein